ncbi:MAG TPA: N-acetyltransferase [Burkholderiales bacterium]
MLPFKTETQPLTDYVVRPAAIGDVPYIHFLVENYAAQGNLLPRSMSELYRHLRDFFVVEVNAKLAGCGALEIFTEDLGEIRSLVVDDKFKRHGFGRLLVERLLDEARRIGLRRIMALTYVPDFFHKLDFKTVPKETLPEKVWGICVKCYKFNNCDEIAVLRELREPAGRG